MSETPPYKNDLITNTYGTAVGLRGLWAAKLWIVFPAIASLPFLWIFGEGDYVVPILSMLWMGCFILGMHFYRSGAAGTVRRSMGLHTAVWSAFLAFVMLVWTIALVIGGTWRWTPPNW